MDSVVRHSGTNVNANNEHEPISQLLEGLVSEFSSTSQDHVEKFNLASSWLESEHARPRVAKNECVILMQIRNKIEGRANSAADMQKFHCLQKEVHNSLGDKQLKKNALWLLLELADLRSDSSSPDTDTDSSADCSFEKIATDRYSRDVNLPLQSERPDYDIYYDRIVNLRRKLRNSSQNQTTASTVRNTRSFESQTEPSMLTNSTWQHVENIDLVQDAIYSFTGTQCEYLVKDSVTGVFKLNPASKPLAAVPASMLIRVSELGYYHDCLKKFANDKSGFGAVGFMGQALSAALLDELNQYYGAVAVLQDKHNAASNASVGEKPTLHSLLIWSCRPLERLQWINKIASECKMKKGGELLSVIGRYLKHGSPLTSSLAQQLLTATCVPLLHMLKDWLLHGEVEDRYNEFFIEEYREIGTDRLWYDKYHLRMPLLPKFIPTQLAKKILDTGKSINFLRHVCHDSVEVPGRQQLVACMQSNPEDFFACVPDTKLHASIERIYQHTAKRVLDIMVGPHKLAQHLQAMRRYLLLGQGDFVGFLMDNLSIELDKPAHEMYSPDLSAILCAAVRFSHPESDESEILNHLDVHINNNYGGELGWDAISLRYTVRGPLATMLEPSMSTYKRIFKPLWRIKRMEFLLSNKIWKNQKFNGKRLRPMAKDLASVTYLLHAFTSEAMHFINQVQYYILFEIIECAWVDLEKRVHAAKALDDILNAHNEFLQIIIRGLFLEPNSEQIANHLSSVFQSVLLLEKWQEKFFEVCLVELERRRAFKATIIKLEKLGEFSIKNEQQFNRDHEHKIFTQHVAAYQKSLDTLSTQYEKNVRDFLLALHSNGDLNLQLFGMRLDFNEYYKKRDKSIHVPLTFEHIRMSNVFSHPAKNLPASRYSSVT